MTGAPDSATLRVSDGVVTLRTLSEHDVDAIVEQSRDEETVRWTSVPESYRREDAHRFMEHLRMDAAQGQRTSWALDHEGRFAGLIHLRTAGNAVAEVSFATHPHSRGKGLMTRAVRLACAYAFERGDEVVLWHALVGNFGSRKVAWASGFQITPGVVWRAGPERRGGHQEQVWAGRLLPGEPMLPRTRWLQPPRIEGDGVRLRPFLDEDVRALPTTLDPEAADYISLVMPTSETYAGWLLDERTLAASGEALSVAIADPTTDAMLGGLRLSRLGVTPTAGSGALAYWLVEDARGSGLLGRALELLLPWAVASQDDGGLGLHRLEASYVLDNRASGRALRRAGFAPVGVERRKMVVGGRLEDVRDGKLFDLLRDDDREAQRVQPRLLRVIETEHFRLREWRPNDVPGPDEGPDEDSVRFMPASAHPNATTFTAWLQRRQLGQDDDEHLNWCIADRVRDHALGNLTIFRLGPARDRFQAELGYWLHPTARGQGVLSETIPPLIDHAFASVAEGGLGLSRLYASTDLNNVTSQRVLLRAGFRRWGHDRQAYRNGLGELTDGAYFELLSTDDRVDRRPRRIEVPVLEGNAIRLRPWRKGDADRIVEACTDPRTRHWLSDLPQDYTEEAVKAFVANCRGQAALGTGLFLAVADRSSDVCLGSVALMGLDGPDPTTGEVGYWTHQAARGRGRMSEAVGLLIPHAFGPLGLRRLTLHAAAGNPASHHVAEINGFRRTGVQRQAERLGDGSFDDLVDFDLLADDLRPSG